MIKLSDYIFSFISGLGVDHVFMLPGGGAMHLVDSLGKNPDIEFVCNLHEQACAISADAYSQYTGNLGVVLVTTGPGGTNALTGVAASFLDSVPVLVISGQVKRSDSMKGLGVRQMGFQEIDIIAMAAPVTKYAVTVTEPETIRFHLEKAVFSATSGRPGPVWLDIPLDVQSALIDPERLEKFQPLKPDSGAGKEQLSPKIKKAYALLNRAKRPVCLVGNGVRSAKAVDLFHELITMLDIPCLTTWRSIDFFPDDHPSYIGRPGSVGQRAANFAQQKADLILILGARLDLGQTGYNHKNFAPNAKKIIVDIDQSEINKLDMALDLEICSDARFFIDAMLADKPLYAPKDITLWWKMCRQWKIKFPVMQPEYLNFNDGISTYVLIDILSESMTEKDLLVPGSSGTCAEITMQILKVKKGFRIINSPALGAMGFGIPAAIGGCLASNGKNTICIDGDGGFQMNIQELETVKRLRLPVKFFILNNNGYASIQATQQTHFDGRFVAVNPDSGLSLPDSERIAKAFDIKFTHLDSHRDIKVKIAEILSFKGPVICDVNISSSQFTAPRLASRQEKDGAMVSCPLEDLWPFLDRDEFQKIMEE